MIVVPTTPSYTPWPVVQPTNSPYWLRVNGQWVHLDGVRRGSRLTTERDTSDLVTIDGVRQRWVAPAGPRSWRLQLQDATPVAVAALMLACDFPGDVLLVDRDLTTANMLPGPACQGTGPALLAGGLPLRTFTAPATVSAYVRGGVRTYVSVWAPGGTAAATVTWPGGDAELATPAGTLAQRAVVDVVPDTDGPLTITAAAGTTGLQVTEDWLPEHWLPGRNAPCPVAVVDPERTLEYLGRRRYSRSSYDVQLDEVGAL